MHGIYDVNIMVFFDLPPCCVDESHSESIHIIKALRSKVDVSVNVHSSFNESIIRNFCTSIFCRRGVHSCSCSSQVLKSICKTIHNNNFMSLFNKNLSTL